MTNERRQHDHLRELVEEACKGLMPHLQERIKNTARRAYYLGCGDGIAEGRRKVS